MRKILLSLAFVATTFLAFAQTPTTCTSDPMWEGFPAGVYPYPDTMDFADPTLGINEFAHQGCFFDFTFTAVVPDSLSVSGFDLDLDSIVIATEGGILGGPAGLDQYVCNPSSCVFEDNTEGCVTLYGTPTDPPGKDSLGIEATVYFNSNVIPQITITFPDPVIAPGEYVVWTVDDVCEPTCNDGMQNGDETGVDCGGATCDACVPDAIRDAQSNFAFVQNNPNPFNGLTTVTYSTKTSKDVDFAVYNVLGKQVYTEKQSAVAGENSFQFDGSDLNPGVYLYTIGSGSDVITKRMVVNK